ncbi:MAG: aspartyl protease family protein [Burkholderiaceae bacterium]|nr:aspartyl protease family protein [Burkholderiaceae bacterium]
MGPMRHLSLCIALVGTAVAAATASASTECRISKFAELPVTMSGGQPLVPAKINGVDVTFLVDSGASYSFISPAGASQHRLELHDAPPRLRARGVDGEVMDLAATYVEELRVADKVLHHFEFLVGGSEFSRSSVGLLGQNVLAIADAEYDLAKGVVRLMQPGNGCYKTGMAYWVKSDPYSVIDMLPSGARTRQMLAVAHLNGKRILVSLDTGSTTSFLTRRAAARAGFQPTAPGVVAGFSHGAGKRNFATWIASFENFKLGDEEIHNARLGVADVDMPDADMVLGADFFLSHHIYVANSQAKVYFTYNGGPVFDLRRFPSEGPTTQQSAGTVSPVEQDPDEPTDAAGLARRGAAYAARRDFTHAIADLTRACELEPNEASYFRQRGLARWGNGQPDLAKNDLDQALKLKPDDVEALLARAKLSLTRHDAPAVVADLQAADQASPKVANVRLEIAAIYTQAEMLEAALLQYDLWIAAHPEDAGQARAKNGRCWVRALMGRDLDKALDDCDHAVNMIGNSAEFLDSRGLVLLRLGKYDRSIDDYDAALRLNPRIAWSLYGRGVARLHKGMTAEGQADIAAAIAVRPSIVDDARKHGIVPPEESSPAPRSH